jgi:hypothetical protein
VGSNPTADKLSRHGELVCPSACAFFCASSCALSTPPCAAEAAKIWPPPSFHDSLAERSKAVAQGAIPKGRGFEPHSCQFSAIRAQLSSRRFCLSLRREETLLGLVRFSCFENLLCQVEFYPRRRNQWGVSFRSPVWAALATTICVSSGCDMTVWPSGLRRWLQAPVRKGVGSNPTAVNFTPRHAWLELRGAPELQAESDRKCRTRARRKRQRGDSNPCGQSPMDF